MYKTSSIPVHMSTSNSFATCLFLSVLYIYFYFSFLFLEASTVFRMIASFKNFTYLLRFKFQIHILLFAILTLFLTLSLPKLYFHLLRSEPKLQQVTSPSFPFLFLFSTILETSISPTIITAFVFRSPSFSSVDSNLHQPPLFPLSISLCQSLLHQMPLFPLML